MKFFNKKTLAVLGATGALAFAPLASATHVYMQDFEGLDAAGVSSLGDDGWLVGANVFDPTGTNFLYNYFAFPAPNGGPAFSGIATGEGGAQQGTQQLSVYNDYNNADHNVGNRIEAIVFQEVVIDEQDAASGVYNFTFDYKQGNIGGATTAEAFVQVLNPATGFSLTVADILNTTATGFTWNTATLSIDLTGLTGQIMQWGFRSTASNFDGSGVFYDNINLAPIPVPAAVWLFGSGLLGLVGVARRRRKA